MKTLLAIINDPANSEDLIRYTIPMADDFKLKLHLLYIQNPALYVMNTGTAIATSHPVDQELDVEQLEEDRKNALKAIENNVNELMDEISSDVSIDLSSETGGMDIIINQFIAENKADMLILENQKEKGFWIMDPSLYDLVLKVNCPCWIIPPDQKYQPYKKIVYATDYNEADIATLKDLLTLTGSFSPGIIAFHITDSSDFEEKAKKTGFRDMVVQETGYDKISVKVVNDTKDRDPGEYINEYATGNNANLIVLLKENKMFIERVFKSSSTKEVLKEASLPVLVYRE